MRNEYCQTVAIEEEGIKTIIALLLNPDQVCRIEITKGILRSFKSDLLSLMQGKTVVRESLKLIKALAGNDNVKKDIQSSGGISVIINSITKNMVRPRACASVCT